MFISRKEPKPEFPPERPSRAAFSATSAWTGKPMQNGFVESFNGRMRDDLLNETLLLDLDYARAKNRPWQQRWRRLQRARKTWPQEIGYW